MTAGHPWWTPLQVAEKHPCRLPDGKPILSRRKSGSRCGRTPKRTAFPGPARTDEGTAPVSMAGAIAPATAPRRDQDQPGAQSPRPAPAPPTAGASPPPGRALASVPPGPAGLQGAVPRGRGNGGSRLRVPPGGARSLPGTQRTSRPASGKIAVSVPGQSATGSRAAPAVGSGAASAMATSAARSGSTDRSAS